MRDASIPLEGMLYWRVLNVVLLALTILFPQSCGPISIYSMIDVILLRIPSDFLSNLCAYSSMNQYVHCVTLSPHLSPTPPGRSGPALYVIIRYTCSLIVTLEDSRYPYSGRCYRTCRKCNRPGKISPTRPVYSILTLAVLPISKWDKQVRNVFVTYVLWLTYPVYQRCFHHKPG